MRSRGNSRMSDQMITFIFPTSTWRPTQEVDFGDAIKDLRLQSLNAEVRHKHGNSRCVRQVSRTHGLAVLSVKKRIICFHLEKPAERGSGEDWAVFHYAAVPRFINSVGDAGELVNALGPMSEGIKSFLQEPGTECIAGVGVQRQRNRRGHP